MGPLSNSNFGIVIGTVCSRVKLRDTQKTIISKVRIKIENQSGFAYLDIYAIADNAKVMNLICKIGTIIYCEYEIGNLLLNAYSRRVIHLATKIERLVITNHKTLEDRIAQFELVEKLDPYAYINSNLKLGVHTKRKLKKV